MQLTAFLDKKRNIGVFILNMLLIVFEKLVIIIFRLWH